MREMTSTEFRVAYVKLDEPTVVTVLGRPIGTWIPTGFESPPVGWEKPKVYVTTDDPEITKTLAEKPETVSEILRQFRPVPKPGKK